MSTLPSTASTNLQQATSSLLQRSHNLCIKGGTLCPQWPSSKLSATVLLRQRSASEEPTAQRTCLIDWPHGSSDRCEAATRQIQRIHDCMRAAATTTDDSATLHSSLGTCLTRDEKRGKGYARAGRQVVCEDATPFPSQLLARRSAVKAVLHECGSLKYLLRVRINSRSSRLQYNLQTGDAETANISENMRVVQKVLRIRQ